MPRIQLLELFSELVLIENAHLLGDLSDLRCRHKGIDKLADALLIFLEVNNVGIPGSRGLNTNNKY